MLWVRVESNPKAPGSYVRIDKGASTPRDGVLARGSEPENIRKPVDSLFAYERAE